MGCLLGRHREGLRRYRARPGRRYPSGEADGCEAIRERLYLLELGEHKDPSALHLADPDGFKEQFEAALEDAKPWVELERAEAEAASREAWERVRS